MTQMCPELADFYPPERCPALLPALRQCSRVFGVQIFFDLFEFLLERLVLHAGAFAPRLAFGFWLGGVSGDLATINFLVTLLLTLKFGAQFFFRHSYYLSYETLLLVGSVSQAVTAPEGDNCRDNSLVCYGYTWVCEVRISSWPCEAGRLTAVAGGIGAAQLETKQFDYSNRFG